MDNGTVCSLCQMPATDGSFISRLQRATDEEIRKAINDMRNSNGKHKSRILACEKELRKRKRGK